MEMHRMEGLKRLNELVKMKQQQHALMPVHPAATGSKASLDAIIVKGSDKQLDCDGVYVRESSDRNGSACYTRESKPGAIYYDGSHWKICQAGSGGGETGWNYSQEGPSAALPLGQWLSSKATHETTQDYSHLHLRVATASDRGSSDMQYIPAAVVYAIQQRYPTIPMPGGGPPHVTHAQLAAAFAALPCPTHGGLAISGPVPSPPRPQRAVQRAVHTQKAWSDYERCHKCGMLGPSSQTGPGGCDHCGLCTTCCAKPEHAVCPTAPPSLAAPAAGSCLLLGRDPAEKARLALQEDGFALQALLPGTDACLLRSLEALLQTEHPEWLGKGKDVSRKYGPYDSLKLACAWKVDHPRNLDKYTTGVKRVQEELELLEKKGKNVSYVPGLPVKTDRVRGLTPSEACNEVILLHGTGPERMLALLSTGLNERYSGTGAGTAFGDGVYLAEDVGKTDQYVCADSAYDPSSELHKRLYGRTVRHPGDVFYVLVVRAALGYPVRTQWTLDNSTEAKTHELRAARVKSMDNNAPVFPINCRELSAVPGVTPPICHHSLIAELGQVIDRYREFVLFHGDYVHIDYVLAYHRCNGGQKLRTT
jgi:hypothetical protein